MKDSGATVCSLRVKKLLISNTISTVSINHFSFQALNITIRTDKKVKKTCLFFGIAKKKSIFVTLSQTVKNMSMKRIFFMFLALLLCVMVQAQDNVEITLNNGNVVKGVTKTLFMLDDGDVVVAKDSKSREKKEYKSTEIKSIKYYDSKSKEWIKFVPLMAQKSLPSVWNKNPKPYKTPIFLKPVYEGKNVSAYIHYISTITNTKTLHLEGTNYVFYFKVKNEDVAKGYWMGSSIGAKMLLKIVFKPYPVMKETVSNLDTKEFDKDPISLIRTFDSLLK